MFIKQVPDTNDVKWTENNNIDRTNMDSIINPVDREAIEAALKIKEQNNAHITAITMGPEKAKEVLHTAIAMGVDDAFLLCDSKFRGSDTLATSKILAAAIKELLPDTDLILTGQCAIDGETGQTGVCMAERLDFPCLNNISEIQSVSDSEIVVISTTEKQEITYKIKLPALLCINNYIYEPRKPLINGYLKAHKFNYKTYNLYDLNLYENETGLKGSPTYVESVYRNEDTRNGIMFNTDETDIKTIYEEIKKVF